MIIASKTTSQDGSSLFFSLCFVLFSLFQVCSFCRGFFSLSSPRTYVFFPFSSIFFLVFHSFSIIFRLSFHYFFAFFPDYYVEYFFPSFFPKFFCGPLVCTYSIYEVRTRLPGIFEPASSAQIMKKHTRLLELACCRRASTSA